MKEIVIRSWLPPDLPDLKDIFTVSFGDPPEVVDAFFRAFPAGSCSCVLAAVPEDGRPDGRPVAAGYRLDGLTLHFSARKQVPCGYLYALGCLPAWRGRGLGMELHKRMFVDAGEQSTVSCMIPVSESMLQAYLRLGRAFPLGRVRFADHSRADLAAGPPAPAAEDLPPAEYARRREALLASRPHAEYPAAWYSLMADFGNRFLALPGALAAVIPLEDRCVVAELLCPDANPSAAIAGVAAACPAQRYVVRTPVFFPGPGEIRGFAYHNSAEEEAPEDFWFPFGLE